MEFECVQSLGIKANREFPLQLFTDQVTNIKIKVVVRYLLVFELACRKDELFLNFSHLITAVRNTEMQARLTFEAAFNLNRCAIACQNHRLEQYVL